MGGLIMGRDDLDKLSSEFDRLKKENERLRELAETDPLTGLYNRMATEEKVTARLGRYANSCIIVFDIDNFKHINDRYGHLTGDLILKEVATMLCYVFWKKDVIGRVGGDEFVAFVASNCTQQMVDGKLDQLSLHFADIGRRCGLNFTLTLSAGISFQEKNDSYSDIFSRADGKLIEIQTKKRLARQMQNEDADQKSEMSKDVELIKTELREGNAVTGAYCQSFEAFKHIYRFMERGIGRSGINTYIILLTLTDPQGNFTPLPERTEQIDELDQTIRASLRTGDTYTQYSSGQFILMVLGTSLENAYVISERITDSFVERVDGSNIRLKYDVYPLEPVANEKPTAKKKIEK